MGASIVAMILLVNLFLAGFSKMTVSTRIMYALARDKALPKSEYLQKLNPLTKNPDRILFVTFVLDSMLCLLALLSPQAYIAVSSITTIGY